MPGAASGRRRRRASTYSAVGRCLPSFRLMNTSASAGPITPEVLKVMLMPLVEAPMLSITASSSAGGIT